MKKEYVYRFLIYIVGLLFLAFGLTLNTTTGLGVSAIISVSNALSEILSVQIGDTTLALYSFFILVEIVIHIYISKTRGGLDLKKIIVFDILQLPLSIVFTRVMNIFSSVLPMLAELEGSLYSTFAFRFIALIIAVIFTGIGAAMSLDMRLIPNPGDGLVQSCSDLFNKEVGLMKNIIDLINISIAVILGYAALGRLVSVGIGTVAAVLFVGRVISIFNRLTLKRLKKISGLL